jgi:hypothetical protein
MVTANALLPSGEVAHRVVWLEPEKRTVGEYRTASFSSEQSLSPWADGVEVHGLGMN